MNKRILILTILSIYFYSNSNGQITTTKIADKLEVPTPIYDSLSNIFYSFGYKQFIGQDIYVLPKSKPYCIETRQNFEEVVKRGYSKFILTPTIGIYDKKNVYKPIKVDNNFATDYNAVAGKYFKIIDIIDKEGQTAYSEEMYLKLESKENKEILYYQVLNGPKQRLLEGVSGTLLFTGYFEKLKNLTIGKKFISQNNFDRLLEIKSGKTISCATGSEWTCLNVTLIESENHESMIPVFIFMDSLSNEIAVGLENKFNKLNINIGDFTTNAFLLEKKRKENNLPPSKLNISEALKVGQIEVGMSMGMCISSWGFPNETSRTIEFEILKEDWKYNLDTYLHFKNGVLERISN